MPTLSSVKSGTKYTHQRSSLLEAGIPYHSVVLHKGDFRSIGFLKESLGVCIPVDVINPVGFIIVSRKGRLYSVILEANSQMCTPSPKAWLGVTLNSPPYSWTPTSTAIWFFTHFFYVPLSKKMLPRKDNQANQFFSASFPEPLFFHLFVEGVHKIQNSLAPQHFVAHVCAQHDVGFVLQNGGCKAGPDHQPAREKKNRNSHQNWQSSPTASS